ncbi:MAG: FAD-dependent oxidoreductase [Lachnospiraceae bacterium]|nr:FAD-dependent oxidoreductase [Lachnospiraceae bacterium]
MMEFDLGVVKEGLQADVIVVGAGPAGMCAAIAAAREGVSVILVEQGGFCGGMATRGLVGPFMTCYDSKGENMIIRGLFEEIVNRMVNKGFAIHPSLVHAGTAFTSWIVVGHEHVTPFEPEGLKLVMDEMLTEAGVKILYHTDFLRPLVEHHTITGILVNSKRGPEVIKGKVVIDCTGDGDVAARCDVPYEYGNEACNLVQPATMFFQISNVDSQAVEADIQANIHNFYRKDGVNYRSLHWRVSEARANGDWDLKRVSIGLFRMPKADEWCVNTSRIMGVDSTDNESLTNAEIEGRKQADMIFKFLRKYVPGCENARLKATASYIGIRESRHIQGDYRLTGEDLISAKVPEDSILLAANSVDVHGRFGPTSNEYVPIQGDYYGVPYRSLLPKGVEQLLIAGRCVSADSTAAGAIRVMPPCMGMGQAAGTAAALAVKEGCSVRQLNTSLLQDVLKGNNVYL